jgi:uncharacterized protein
VSRQNVTEREGEYNHALRLRDILAFFGLTFALTIPFWIIGSMSAIELMPGLPIAALAVICPATAALILSWRLTGVASARALLMRTIDLERVKPEAWWLLILLFSPAAHVAAFFISRNLGTAIPNPQINIFPTVMLFAIFLIFAVTEEMGWTGFALGPIQSRVGAIPAGLLIGAIWAVWHYPALLQAHRSGVWIAWWILGTISLRLFMVWLFNATGGSVFAVVMVHATNNLSWQLFPIQGSWWDPRIIGLTMGSVALIVIFTSISKNGQDQDRFSSKDDR